MSGRHHTWPDLAKGLSIVIVVYGHAVVGVTADIPIDPGLYALLMKPLSQFRMPLFLFVSGLFAANALKRSWPEFVDRTLLQLIYVFVLWNLLQYGSRMAFAGFANHPVDPTILLRFPIDPLNVTWFIWALIVYNVICRAWQGHSHIVLFAVATFLALDPIEGVTYALEQTTRFFVFFLAGTAMSSWLLGRDWKVKGWHVGLSIPAYFIGSALFLQTGLAEHAAAILAMRCAGITSIILLCMWFAGKFQCTSLAWLGRNSIAIFVMHTIVTAGARELLLRTGLTDNFIVLVMAAWIAGVVVPLALKVALDRLGVPWLFRRPSWFRLPRREPAMTQTHANTTGNIPMTG
ncbi:MAG: acyltransferase [Geminicoccaceae bacterium]|nr:acyltransferase [Geminicoccaceae bacterium]